MGDYSVVNLKDVENQGPNFGLDPADIEFRMARVALDCKNSGVSYLKLGPGWRMPFGHVHKQQEEIYVLVNGSARMKLDDEVIELQPWTAVRVAKDTMRGYEGGPGGAELIAIGAPNTGPGDADVEQGWWN